MPSPSQPTTATLLFEANALIKLEADYDVEAKHLSEALGRGEYTRKDLAEAVECLRCAEGNCNPAAISDQTRRLIDKVASNFYSPKTLEQVLNVLTRREELFALSCEAVQIMESIRIQVRSIAADDRKLGREKIKCSETIDLSPYLLSLKLNECEGFSVGIQEFFSLNELITFRDLVIFLKKSKPMAGFEEEISDFLSQFGINKRTLRRITIKNLEKEAKPRQLEVVKERGIEPEVATERATSAEWLEGFKQAQEAERLRQEQADAKRLAKEEARREREENDRRAAIVAMNNRSPRRLKLPPSRVMRDKEVSE